MYLFTPRAPRRSSWPGLASLVFILGFPSTQPAQALSVDIDVIAITGDTAPDTAQAFTGFLKAAAGPDGSVAYEGVLANGQSGLWYQDPAGDTRRVADKGARILAVVEDGVMFNRRLDGPPLRSALWIVRGADEPRLLIAESQLAPGTTGIIERLVIGEARANYRGDLLVSGLLQAGNGVHGPNDEGIWGPVDKGEFGLVAREGSPAPGTPWVLSRSLPFSSEPALGPAGHVAFNSFLLRGGSIDSSNDHGFWAPVGDTLGLVAREGDAAPGTSGIFAGVGESAALNGSGAVVFFASLKQGIGGVDSSNDSGIWRSDGRGGLSLLFREGDPVPRPGRDGAEALTPNAGSAAVAASTGAGPLVLDGRGRVAFLVKAGIAFSDDDGNIQLAARKGDLIPDRVGTFTRVTCCLAFSGGDLLFGATADGARRGTFLRTESGEIRTLLLDGDILEVAPGDFRVIESSGVFPIGPRLMAAKAKFRDGTSAILRIRVPEPGLASLLLPAIVGLLRRRPRRERVA